MITHTLDRLDKAVYWYSLYLCRPIKIVSILLSVDLFVHSLDSTHSMLIIVPIASCSA